jgi:hypothetical protein
MLSGSCANEASSSKRHENTVQDMISNLSEFIIGHILYFLCTKEAVLTSVSSKRWKYMWTFATKISFSDFDPPPHSITKFCASHITKFSYCSHISSQTNLLDDQCIPSAKILVPDPMNQSTVEEIWIFTRKLLCLFIKAESLELSLPYYWKVCFRASCFILF